MHKKNQFDRDVLHTGNNAKPFLLGGTKNPNKLLLTTKKEMFFRIQKSKVTMSSRDYTSICITKPFSFPLLEAGHTLWLASVEFGKIRPKADNNGPDPSSGKKSGRQPLRVLCRVAKPPSRARRSNGPPLVARQASALGFSKPAARWQTNSKACSSASYLTYSSWASTFGLKPYHAIHMAHVPLPDCSSMPILAVASPGLHLTGVKL